MSCPHTDAKWNMKNRKRERWNEWKHNQKEERNRGRGKCFFDLFRGYCIEDKISLSRASMSNPHFILLVFVKNKICLISNLTSSKGGGKVIHLWGEVEKQSFSLSFLFLDTNLGGKIWKKKKEKKKPYWLTWWEHWKRTSRSQRARPESVSPKLRAFLTHLGH